MQCSRRQAVFVSGAPGAGKTSLAVPLAAELGFALVSKDRIKETLHDALGAPEPDLAWSRTLGAAAMELLWALAADAPSVVVEANFRPRDPYQRGKLAALADDPVEVYCRCDPALAARRYRDRARTSHPVHVVTSLTPEMLAEYDQPVGIGEPVTVDTAVPVDAAAVAAAVRARLRGPAALWCGHAGGGGPMAFVIRDAVPADVAVLRQVYRRASLSNQGDRTNLLANPDVLEWGGLGDDRRTRVAATASGRIVGFATSLPAGDALELDDLFVDPDWMRQGAARALVLDVVAHARNEGIGRIQVTANQHALVFYRKAGFVVDREVQTRFGPGLRMHLDVAR